MKILEQKQLFGGSTKRIRILGLSFFALLALFVGLYYISVVSPNTARAFSGVGEGTLDVPYRITNCTQLQEMNTAPTNYFVLTQDIDCNDTVNWNSGQGFQPINFSGGLDGRNYSITGLYINRPTEYAVGLFSYTTDASFVTNLRFLNGPSTEGQVAINGGSNVGVIAGELLSGMQLKNIYSELNVQGNGKTTNVGGLVGINRGYISYAKVTGLVSLSQSNLNERYANLGGIAGLMDGYNNSTGSLIDSYSLNDISMGTNDSNNFSGLNCGGIVGYSDAFSSVAKDYSAGSIYCSANAASQGGIVGRVARYASNDPVNNPQVVNNFTLSSVTGSLGYKGGIVGNLEINDLDIGSNYFDSTAVELSECAGTVSSACTAVNTDGSEPDYFYDSNRAVYGIWDRTSDWELTGSALPILKQRSVRANPPTDLLVTRNGNDFDISWTASAVEGGRSDGITDYQIYYRTHGSDQYSWVYYDDAISTNTSAVLSGLTIPGNYDFRIRAMSDYGSGLYSTEYNFATGMPETAPQNIQNTPAAKSFTFNWEAVDTATSYQLRYRKTGASEWIENGIIEYSNLQAILRGLTEQTSYEFQISAVNAAGNGPWSNTITASTSAIIDYTISNCTELQAMRDDLDGAYTLATNIDCDGVNFQPVGNGKLFFAGSLDGKGYAINNLTIDVTTTNDGTKYEGAGLFGVIADAELKNIIINNASVSGIANLAPEIDTDSNGLPDAPTLPIDPANPQIPTQEEAINAGQTAGQQTIGGAETLTRWALGTVAGVVGGSGTYSNIRVNNTIVSGAVSGGVFGIVIPLSTFTTTNNVFLDFEGQDTSLVLDNLSSNGSVFGFISGGLIAIAASRPDLQSVEPVSLTIQNSNSSATVEANIGGGLLGFGSSRAALALLGIQDNTPTTIKETLSSQNVIIRNSSASGLVSACQAPSQVRVGALGGLIGAGSGVSIESSSASGAVSTCSASTLDEQVFGNAYGGVMGGLSGALLQSRIVNSHATGAVRAINTLPADTNKYPVYIGVAGGLSGVMLNSGDQNGNYVISNSYATGNVNAESPTGLVSINAGLVGAYVGSGTIQSSYATGAVKNTMQSNSQGGSSISGGLVGVGLGLDVSYYLGLILQDPATPTYGLVINNSYATGEVRNTKVGPGVGLSIAGGATGTLLGKVTLANSHATGNVINETRTKLEVDTGDGTGESAFETLSQNDGAVSIAGGLSGVAIGLDLVPIISPDVVDPATAPAAIRIDSTYASGNVNGLITGGLLGSGELSLSINKSYSTGSVQGSLAGGIAGQVGGASVITSGALISFNLLSGNSALPFAGITAATINDSTHTIDITNTYSTSNITGVRNLLQLNPQRRNADNAFLNGVDTYTPSAIGGLIGVNLAPGGLLENSYASGKITMPTVSFPKGREPNQLKLPEIPAFAGGVVGFNIAVPKPNAAKISSPEASSITDLNEFVIKPQTIRNVFSASELSISGDTVTAGFAGTVVSPLKIITGDDISDSSILNTSNNYYDRSKITVNDCSGPSGSGYDLVNSVYKTEYIPDQNDNNGLPAEFPQEWASTYVDPVIKRPSCNLVNVNNTQPNYFINNKTNAPLTSWNFNGLWYTQQKDYPKFVAGAISPENPGVGPTVPKAPTPPSPIIPEIPTVTTSTFSNPTTVGYVRNIANKLGKVNASPQRVKGLKVLIASVPPVIAQSLPYVFILFLLLLAALYSWQALRQYAELTIYRKQLMRIIATKESVDNFLAITTHYLNTPSAIMGGAVELLLSLKKISKEKADMLTKAIKKNASDSEQLLVDNQVSGAKSTSDLKQIHGKQTNPLLRREVWVPALISLSLIVLANIIFMYAEVFSRSRIRIGIEVMLFALSLALVVLAYRYRDMLEDTKRLARERLRIEKDLYEKRSAFIPKAAATLGANVTSIRNAGAGLKTIPQSTLFYNGLAKLEEVSIALNNLKTFANVSDKPPLFDVTTYINRVIRETQVKAQEKKVTIVADVDLGIVTRIQPAEIKQLFTSVLDNAVKFSNDEGSVTVSVHKRFNKIALTVKDQGIGISNDKLPSLLRPFTRGTDSMQYNYEGIGLDLYADKVIVDKLGGKISITSQLKKGTSVSISIPINRASGKGGSAIAINSVD